MGAKRFEVKERGTVAPKDKPLPGALAVLCVLVLFNVFYFQRRVVLYLLKYITF